jgi:hypothetical protein
LSQAAFSHNVGSIPQFVNGLNETADVMRQHLAQRFVDLRCFGFAAETVAKLGFNHGERRFDI